MASTRMLIQCSGVFFGIKEDKSQLFEVKIKVLTTCVDKCSGIRKQGYTRLVLEEILIQGFVLCNLEFCYKKGFAKDEMRTARWHDYEHRVVLENSYRAWLTSSFTLRPKL